jgi:hypothetical protein
MDKPAGKLALGFLKILASLTSALARTRFSHSNFGGNGLTSEPLSARPTRFNTSRLKAAAGSSSALA